MGTFVYLHWETGNGVTVPINFIDDVQATGERIINICQIFHRGRRQLDSFGNVHITPVFFVTFYSGLYMETRIAVYRIWDVATLLYRV